MFFDIGFILVIVTAYYLGGIVALKIIKKLFNRGIAVINSIEIYISLTYQRFPYKKLRRSVFIVCFNTGQLSGKCIKKYSAY